MTNKILISKGKHGDNYFDVSTPEAFAGATLALLKINYPYYYRPEKPSEVRFKEEELQLLELTDDDLTKLPEFIKKSTTDVVNRLRRRKAEALRDYEEAVTWIDQVDALLALPYDEAVKQTGTLGVRNPHKVPLAYVYLQDRQDYEYEGFEIELLVDPRKEVEG